MAKEKFLSYLKYDYNKYIKKLDSLEEEIEKETATKIIASSPDVITSSTWQNAHNEESYSDAKERMDVVTAKKKSQYKSKDLQKWIDEGLFIRRLTFENGVSFYITTAPIEVNMSFGDDFIISPWNIEKEWTVKQFMQMDLGSDPSPKHGELDMLGYFTPLKDDLTKVRYKNLNGKEEFLSAKNTLSGKEIVDSNEASLIDTSSFFRLEFKLAEFGDQSRALYDMDNAIIDGAAGTGKSITALQKLKVLHESKNIMQDKMLVVVKNSEAIKNFEGLLKSDVLALDEVNIYHVDEFFNSLGIDSSISIEHLNSLQNSAESIKKKIESMIQLINLENIQHHFSILINDIGKEFFVNTIESMIEEIENDKDKTLQISDLRIDLEDINKSLLNEDVDDEEKLELIELLKSKTRKIEQLSGDNYKKALKTIHEDMESISTSLLTDIVGYSYNSKELTSLEVLLWLKTYINFHLNKIKNEQQLQEIIEEMKSLNPIAEDKLELDEIKKELDEVAFYASETPNDKELQKELRALKSKYKKQTALVNRHDVLPKKKVDLEEKTLKTFTIEPSEKRKYIGLIQKIYFAKAYIINTFLESLSEADRYLSLCYLLGQEHVVDTLIVDEAQDYTLVELELLRFQAKRIILTGDILQNLDPTHMQSWKNILNVDTVYGVENNVGDKILNIFNLKHNFRQTYQLANASYNFRQLLLDSGLEDIQQEYYLSEKEFNGKPYRLPTINQVKDSDNLYSFIEEKIEKITNRYSSKIPITIIYKTDVQKERYMSVLHDYKISEQSDKHTELDILLVDIFDSKGKEFPLVISDLDSLTDNEIYLIMTRAQFELDFYTEEERCPNKNLQALIDENWVDGGNILDFEANNIVIEDSLKEEDVGENESKTTASTSVIDKLKNIVKHYGNVKQKKDEIEPSIIKNEQKYKNDFLEQLNKQQLLPRKKDVVFLRKEVDKDTSRVNNEIKAFLYSTYKGYCQLCGFTFRKVNDGENSFEKFNWNDKRVVKVKKDFVSSADSLCLCRNCAANIKFGDFEPIFVDKISSISNFESQSFEFIMQTLHSVVDDGLHDIFKDHIDFDDIFALEIKLNQESKNLCFTREHLIQFITFLQLEEKNSVENSMYGVD